MRTGLFLFTFVVAAPAAFADATTPVVKQDPKKNDGKPDTGKTDPTAPHVDPARVGVVATPTGRPRRVGMQRRDDGPVKTQTPIVVGQVRKPDGVAKPKDPGNPPALQPQPPGTMAAPRVGTTASSVPPAADSDQKKERPAHGAPPKP